MDNNSLLMIVLAFILGYMASGMMKSMCGGRLIEGKKIDWEISEESCRGSDDYDVCGYGCGSVNTTPNNPFYEEDIYKCSHCPVGTYNRTNDKFVSCKACPNNTSTRKTGASTREDCIRCKDNYYGHTDTNGHLVLDDSGVADKCTPCPSKSYSWHLTPPGICSKCNMHDSHTPKISFNDFKILNPDNILTPSSIGNNTYQDKLEDLLRGEKKSSKFYDDLLFDFSKVSLSASEQEDWDAALNKSRITNKSGDPINPGKIFGPGANPNSQFNYVNPLVSYLYTLIKVVNRYHNIS